MNAREEEFGEERLLQVIREDCDRSATDLRHAILTAVRSFLGGEPAHDDQTLLIARFLGVASELTFSQVIRMILVAALLAGPALLVGRFSP